MTAMQKTREEGLKDFLQEVREELDCVVQRRGIYAAVVRNYVAIAIKLLMEGNFVLANTKLKSANGVLTEVYAQDDLEDFYEARCAFDLGFFASSWWVHFDHEINDLAKQIWDARREFLPYLSEALRVAYLYSIYLKGGKKPRWALYYALKTPNRMYLRFDYSVYYNKCIGEVLPKGAVNKLKQILYAHAHKWGLGNECNRDSR